MPVYREMPIFEIQVSHFNPNKRIEERALTGLLLSIREHGILKPLDLAHDLTLADGHRRRQCAILLKMPTVPVAVHTENPMSAAELWVALNGDSMNLTPAQWLAAVEGGLPLDVPGFPKRLRQRIEHLQKLIDHDDLQKLIEAGRSPTIIDAAIRALNYMERPGDEEFLKKILHWLINVGNAWTLRTAQDDQVPIDILVEAIEEKRPIGRRWDFAE